MDTEPRGKRERAVHSWRCSPTSATAALRPIIAMIPVVVEKDWAGHAREIGEDGFRAVQAPDCCATLPAEEAPRSSPEGMLAKIMSAYTPGEALDGQVGQHVEAAATTWRQPRAGAESGAAMSPPPQTVRWVLMVVPSLKMTWSAAISFAETPSSQLDATSLELLRGVGMRLVGKGPSTT